jgi:hypothetical protein
VVPAEAIAMGEGPVDDRLLTDPVAVTGVIPAGNFE